MNRFIGHYSKGTFQPSEIQELKHLYAKLFSVPEYSLELPVSYRKYTTLKLNGKQLGSHRSRSSSSSVVIASWNYQLFGPSTCTSSAESSEDGEDRPVRINYFAVHTFTLRDTARDVKIILFFASWFKFHPNKDSCGKPVTKERKIIKNEKRCRNGVPKSAQTRKDKSDGKYTKPHPSLHLFTKEQRCRNWALYIYHHFYPCLCIFWHAIPTSLFIFNDFSFLFPYFFGNVHSCVVK